MKALLWGVFVLGIALPAQALPDNTWVLAIGNNRGDADEIGLHYAEDDARAVVKVLRELGGVASDRIVMLAGEDAATVQRTLDALKARMGSAGALLVYYSGHSDATALHLGGTRLPLEALVQAVRAAPAKTRLLVLDACRSGGASRVKGVRASKSFELDFLQDAAVEGLAVITSSTAREASLESDRLRGSFFTHFLVGGMRGAADTNGDELLTLNEVYDYAYAETVRASGRTASLQHPTFAVDMKGKGAVVLTRLKAARQQLGRLTLDEQAVYLVQDAQDGRVMAEVKPTRKGAQIVLPARTYAVQRRDAAEYREYTVRLPAGRTIALADLPFRSVQYDRLVRRRGGEKRYVHGLQLLGGLRGEVLAGEGALPQIALGYSLDLPWFSTGIRVRGAQVDGTDGLQRTRREIGVGLLLERFTDLDWFSVSFGVLIEGFRFDQTFETTRQAPDVEGFGASFSGVFAVERAVAGGLSLRIEGGPTTTLMPRTQVEDGAPTEDTIAPTLTWSSQLGLIWRL